MTHQAVTLALANQKGGVGKTTTAVNLSAILAHRGYRILLVDLDPQGNATSSLGIEKRTLTQTVYDILVNDKSAASLVIPQVRENLDIIPSNSSLAGAEVALVDLLSLIHI